MASGVSIVEAGGGDLVVQMWRRVAGLWWFGCGGGRRVRLANRVLTGLTALPACGGERRTRWGCGRRREEKLCCLGVSLSQVSFSDVF
ncbi:hypothetical protein Hdeb2414_s0002g00057121 [Helianthus debilis subsp. tardiflorus]